MRHRVVWNRWTLAGLAVVTLLGLAALAAPWLAPGDATRGDLTAALRSPSSAYLLGTDAQGRDVLSRVLFGARLSLAVGLASQVIALAAGLALGLTAGFYGRWVDAVVMRVADVTLAFPSLLLLIAVAAAGRPSLPVLCISWGAMIAEGRDLLRVAPWVSLFPGLAIGITVLGVNLVGDGLRDALDVRT